MLSNIIEKETKDHENVSKGNTNYWFNEEEVASSFRGQSMCGFEYSLQWSRILFPKRKFISHFS